MENSSSFAKVVFVLALIATIIGFTAFSQTPSFKPEEKLPAVKPDTGWVKGDKNEDNRNFDQLGIRLKELDLKLDQLTEEMKNREFSKSQKELTRVMKDMNKVQISKHVEQALKEINWHQLNKQMESVAKLEKVNAEAMKTQLERAKAAIEKQNFNFHFSTPDFDSRKIKEQTTGAMNNAKRSLQEAKEEITNLREFTKALERDGLIDKLKSFKIEVKAGELFINGTKQSKSVSDRYKRFYRKNNFSIKLTGSDDTWI